MRGEQDLKDANKKNLINSGCNKKQIEKFFELSEQKQKDEIITMLKEHKEN